MARLGISIYPEHSKLEDDLAYIRLAGSYGLDRKSVVRERVSHQV